MSNLRTLLTGFFGCALGMLPLTRCRADFVINSVGDIIWNRQSPVPQLVFSITANDSTSHGANSNTINSFNLLFRIQANGPATGNIVFQTAVPAANSVFSSFSDLTFNSNIGNGFASVQGQNAIVSPNPQPGNVTLPPGASRNLFAVNLAPSVDAIGEFTVLISNTSNCTFVDEFDGVAFENLPFSDPPIDVSLGTFRVSAVPEPGSITLVLSGLGLVIARRKMRRQ